MSALFVLCSVDHKFGGLDKIVFAPLLSSLNNAALCLDLAVVARAICIIASLHTFDVVLESRYLNSTPTPNHVHWIGLHTQDA